MSLHTMYVCICVCTCGCVYVCVYMYVYCIDHQDYLLHYRSIIDGAALSLCGRLKEHDNQVPKGTHHPLCALVDCTVIILQTSSCNIRYHFKTSVTTQHSSIILTLWSGQLESMCIFVVCTVFVDMGNFCAITFSQNWVTFVCECSEAI